MRKRKPRRVVLASLGVVTNYGTCSSPMIYSLMGLDMERSESGALAFGGDVVIKPEFGLQFN